MSDTTIYAVITYLIIFRVAIILVGGVSIVLGYRLFVRGIFSPGGGDAGGSLEAKLAGYEISMKNAAPGTFFALFGAIVIAAMILSSPPEIKVEQQSNQPIATQQDGTATAETGGAIETSSSITARGGKDADTWHNEAWDHLDNSLKAAKQAVELTGTSENRAQLDNYLDTLAAISFFVEKDNQARMKALDQAPDNADFRKKLKEYCRSTAQQC